MSSAASEGNIDMGRGDDGSDGSENEWEYIEDTIRPEETLDANGDPVDSDEEEEEATRAGKRKVYATSVRLEFVQLRLV